MIIRNRCVLLVVLVCGFAAWAQPPQPFWTVDLAKFGYQGRKPPGIENLSQSDLMRFGPWIYQQGVGFTDSNVVVVHFLTHENPPGATKDRVPSLSDPFRLVAVFLNARNGELITKLDWPLPTNPQCVPPTFFLPAAGGRFVVVIGNTLTLYSSDFRPLAHIETQLQISATMSPSGESLLLRTEDQSDSKIRYKLVDTKQLAVLKTWRESSSNPRRSPPILWDDVLAWTESSFNPNGLPDYPVSIYFKAPSTEPKAVLTTREQLCGQWGLISKGELEVPLCGDTHKLVTVSTEAKVTREFDLEFEQVMGPIVASAKGERFAISSFRWGSAVNKVPDRIRARVFGPGSAVPLMTLDLPRDYWGDGGMANGGLALSPDGELLAMKSGATVEMYRVAAGGIADNCEANCTSQADARSKSRAPQTIPGPAPSHQLIEQMLSWLPADTETVMGTTGPFLLPRMEQDSSGHRSVMKSQHEVQDIFKQFQLIFLLDLSKDFGEEPIVAAIQGSRNFRPPTGLGVMRSQDGAIAVFAADITEHAKAFLKDSASKIVRTVQIGGA